MVAPVAGTALTAGVGYSFGTDRGAILLMCVGSTPTRFRHKIAMKMRVFEVFGEIVPNLYNSVFAMGKFWESGFGLTSPGSLRL
jgi:hypothetical protein